MDTQAKLQMLADASRYDLACSCGTNKEEHRRRGQDGMWLYPVTLPSGGQSILLKTLVSNSCVNDCRYCPLRNGRDIPRCTLGSDEIARVFMGYVQRIGIHGIFLSSGVLGDADSTMDRMNAVARILRGKFQYRGYIHLKILPGASEEAIRDSLSLASAVSLNIEAPTRSTFQQLSRKKDYDCDIVGPIKRISELTSPGSQFEKVKQTTQFIVGASNETDSQLVRATYGLYKRLHFNRVYYSAYQRGAGDPAIPGEQSCSPSGDELLTREHRLYQADWLIRKYGFGDDEIPFGQDGNLSLAADPKKIWADRHSERFPININRADRFELLRVPGFGLITVRRILELRRNHGRIWSLESLGLKGKRLAAARTYVKIA